jgi:hypothetical protein
MLPNRLKFFLEGVDTIDLTKKIKEKTYDLESISMAFISFVEVNKAGDFLF